MKLRAYNKMAVAGRARQSLRAGVWLARNGAQGLTRPACRSKKFILIQALNLREPLKDLRDYLDLLEARTRNKGKRTFTTDEVRKQLGLV